MRTPKYRLIVRHRLSDKGPLYIIERKDSLLGWMGLWIFVDAFAEKSKAETLLAQLRSGHQFETRTVIG